MNNERIVYWAVGKEVWQGVQEKLKGGWWRKPETEKIFVVCKDEEEAKECAKKLNKYFS